MYYENTANDTNLSLFGRITSIDPNEEKKSDPKSTSWRAWDGKENISSYCPFKSSVAVPVICAKYCMWFRFSQN